MTLKRTLVIGNVFLACIRILWCVTAALYLVPSLASSPHPSPWMSSLAEYRKLHLTQKGRRDFDSTGVVNRKRRRDGSVAVRLCYELASSSRAMGLGHGRSVCVYI